MKTRFNEQIARKLWDDGYDDDAMAIALGVSVKRVKDWRGMNRLARTRERRSNQTEEDTNMKKQREETVPENVEERAAERAPREDATEPPAEITVRPGGNFRLAEAAEMPAKAAVEGMTVGQLAELFGNLNGQQGGTRVRCGAVPVTGVSVTLRYNAGSFAAPAEMAVVLEA